MIFAIGYYTRYRCLWVHTPCRLRCPWPQCSPPLTLQSQRIDDPRVGCKNPHKLLWSLLTITCKSIQFKGRTISTVQYNVMWCEKYNYRTGWPHMLPTSLRYKISVKEIWSKRKKKREGVTYWGRSCCCCHCCCCCCCCCCCWCCRCCYAIMSKKMAAIITWQAGDR